MEFTIKAHINASPKDVYEAWLSSDKHSKMTGGLAQISSNVGESYTAWDGYIEGRNILLQTNERIVQSWRTSEFHVEEEDSQLEIILEDHNGETELTLIHTNVPEHGEQYIQGWEDNYFLPMNEFFSKK
ncbi:MAG: SRPBCC domain-containing protein [Bacteroidia bacterium]